MAAQKPFLVVSIALLRQMAAEENTESWNTEQPAYFSFFSHSLYDPKVSLARDDHLPDHCITEKEHYDGWQTDGSTITINAGQRTSYEAAECFSKDLTKDNILGNPSNPDQCAFPPKIMVVIMGNLSLKLGATQYDCGRFYIALRDIYAANEFAWFLASPTCQQYCGDSSLECKCLANGFPTPLKFSFGSWRDGDKSCWVSELWSSTVEGGRFRNGSRHEPQFDIFP